MGERLDPPESLGEAGAALWHRIIGDLDDGWELDERELHLLESACHVRDDIAALEEQVAADGQVVRGARGNPVVHPGLQEARQLRIVELRLLKAIELEDPKADETPTTRKARMAAQARWNRDRDWKRRRAELAERM